MNNFNKCELNIEEYGRIKSFILKANVENAGLFTDILISDVLDIDFSKFKTYITKLKAGANCEKIYLSDEQKNRIYEYVKMLEEGKPIQYITNKAYFYGLEFYVDNSVLIPRFDTEILVEKALTFIFEGAEVLDLCCGSGCIGITLASLKNIKVTLADFSLEALRVATQNINKHGVENRVSTVLHDVMQDNFDKQFDIIVSNPPYIPTAEIQTLSADVKQEPFEALNGGKNGLDFYNTICKKYKNNLKSEGILVFECGKGQFRDVINIMKENNFKDTAFCSDYAGIERVVYGKKEN